MMNIKFLSSEDAVSEVIDFVTILGILVLSIGLIGVTGYPIVKSVQEANHIENTRQSFIVLANNVNKVVMGLAPSQNVELKMYGGSLSVAGSSSINITAKNSTNENVILVDRKMRSIESVVGETIIAYEGTGIWAQYPNGNTVPVSKPLFSNQSNMIVIPVVSIGGTSSMAGSGMGRVTARGVPGVTIYNNMSNINVTINSTYLKGWEDYFFNAKAWSLCPSGECTAKFDRNNIDVYILNIQLDTEVE